AKRFAQPAKLRVSAVDDDDRFPALREVAREPCVCFIADRGPTADLDDVHRLSSAPRCNWLTVRDEFQQRTVRIAEVDARPHAACAEPLNRSEFDLDTVRREVLLRLDDRTRPLKAQIAPARRYRSTSNRLRVETRAVQIQLLATEPIDPAGATCDQLRSQHV